jgi:hypothetical protein
MTSIDPRKHRRAAARSTGSSRFWAYANPQTQHGKFKHKNLYRFGLKWQRELRHRIRLAGTCNLLPNDVDGPFVLRETDMNTRDLVELSEHDLQHVTGGVVAGESADKDHKDDTGYGGPATPRHLTSSSGVGSKI